MKKIIAVLLTVVCIGGSLVGCSANQREKKAEKFVETMLTTPNEKIANAVGSDPGSSYSLVAGEDGTMTANGSSENVEMAKIISELTDDMADKAAVENTSSKLYQNVLVSYQLAATLSGVTTIPESVVVFEGKDEYHFTYVANVLQKNSDGEEKIELSGEVQFSDEEKISLMTVEGHNFGNSIKVVE